MGWVSGIAVYVISWCVVWLAVLPWGVRTDPATGQVGAPLKPMLGRKLIATTLITALVWLVINYMVSQPDFMSFREMAKEIPME